MPGSAARGQRSSDTPLRRPAIASTRAGATRGLLDEVAKREQEGCARGIAGQASELACLKRSRGRRRRSAHWRRVAKACHSVAAAATKLQSA